MDLGCDLTGQFGKVFTAHSTTYSTKAD